MAEKLSAEQVQRIELIQGFQRSLDRVKRLVAELEGNRNGKPTVISGICSTIGRELAQMRQRAVRGNAGTLGDVAGALSVLANRTAGVSVKLRGLTEGMVALTMQLDLALKAAMRPEPKDRGEQPS